ncbi:MAG TPA: hypothetical protein DCG34_07880, partial [Clostridiales bacterium]|nr:hypothetical protein [Clostridiales bacterium]
MKEWFEDKKLLLLGGKPSGSTDIVAYAKAMGAYVIVTDYLEQNESPAKRLADESWTISTDDVDTLVRLAIENGVDAVATGVHEFNISKTIELAQRLKLPFYATRDQWNLCANKDSFKRLCMDFDIPVTMAYSDFDINNYENYNDLVFPVIIKPVDSSGGKGIFICFNAVELGKSIVKALKFSKSKNVLIERYVSAEEVTLYYTAQDGEIMLTMMADRCVKHYWKDLMPLPVSFDFPSKYLDLYMETMDHQVREMFKSIGIRNGAFFIQSFCDGSRFTFYEMGLRISGNLQYKIMSEINGLDVMEMLVNFSMSGKMFDRPLKKLIQPKYDRKASILNVFVLPGEIGKIIGLEEVKLMDGVLDVVQMHKEGTRILDTDIGTLKQSTLKIYIVA